MLSFGHHAIHHKPINFPAEVLCCPSQFQSTSRGQLTSQQGTLPACLGRDLCPSPGPACGQPASPRYYPVFARARSASAIFSAWMCFVRELSRIALDRGQEYSCIALCRGQAVLTPNSRESLNMMARQRCDKDWQTSRYLGPKLLLGVDEVDGVPPHPLLSLYLARAH